MARLCRGSTMSSIFSTHNSLWIDLNSTFFFLSQTTTNMAESFVHYWHLRSRSHPCQAWAWQSLLWCFYSSVAKRYHISTSSGRGTLRNCKELCILQGTTTKPDEMFKMVILGDVYSELCKLGLNCQYMDHWMDKTILSEFYEQL